MGDQLLEHVKRMQAEGVPESDIIAFVQKFDSPAEPQAKPEQPNTMSGLMDAALRSKGIERTPAEREMSDNMAAGVMGGGLLSAAPAAATQGPKLIQGLARRLYAGLLKPKQAVKDSFGGAKEIAGTLLENRTPISKGGLEKITGRLSDSRNAAMSMVKAAEDAGSQGVVAKDVLSEFAPVVGELRKRVDIGQASELPKVGARGAAILRTTARTGGDIPLTKAQQLKETAQDAASGAYRAMERGSQKQLGADDLLDAAVARGMKQGIERRVPGVGPQNAKSQALIGAKRALEDAVEREANNNMIGGGRDWAALMAGGLGTATGGPMLGAPSAAAMRLLATPSTGSRIAIGLNEASKLGLDDAMQRALMLVMSQGSHQQ